MTDYVMLGLTKRRAELTGKIEAAHEQLRQMLIDLESLDATIIQFSPDFKVESIKPKAFRPPKDWSNRGQMSRVVLSILRQAAEPLSTRDIALEMLVSRGVGQARSKAYATYDKARGSGAADTAGEWTGGEWGRNGPIRPLESC